MLTKALMGVALLILLVPLGASAQGYRDRRADRGDRFDRREVRDAVARLDNSSTRLENDLNYTPGRRVLGVFQLRTTDSNAIAEVRDFRRTLRELRNRSDNGRDLSGTVDEAQRVLDRGVALDRYLRLRTGSAQVDADLSELRSNLHTLADAYGLSMRF
jgi:hypothetical protein